jgi:hypothetical protein
MAGSWYRLLLPEKTNNVILLLSYLGLIAIWKHAWNDMKRAGGFFLKGRWGIAGA